jgi:predicted alpha/beta superfamily hydrolase
MMIAASVSASTVTLRFRVTTAVPLPAGEQVFITGNCPALGNWRPDGMPLERNADRVWTGEVEVERGAAIEFKVTRGEWGSEQILADGRVPDNYTVRPVNDETVEIQVAAWKDSAPMPTPKIEGDYRIHPAFHSQFLRYDRTVIVWLPPSYKNDPEKRYPVLYMQDGQQVFDPQTSTWHQDWQVDERCTELIGEFQMEEVIVVAVYSTEDRYLEYNPSALGGEYARFLLEELKPFIDKEYRTLPDREHTAIAGASMGATIAFYLAWARADAFFGAACLSPAFRYRDDASCLDMVRGSRQAPDLRLHFYCGEGDDLERRLIQGMREMVDLLKPLGFEEGRNLNIVVDPEGKHNEATWARHTREWLLFLFGR